MGIQQIRFWVKNHASSIPGVPGIAGRLRHPWYNGFAAKNTSIPDILTGQPYKQVRNPLDLSSPILFLARGHSGTTPLARILTEAGVYIGNSEDGYALNPTLDALYWIYGLQRTLVPRLFKPGIGCLVDEHAVTRVGLECLKRHLSAYASGPWGFKTCAGMFAHSLYRYLFPQAKFIYLVRDGRDVILSGNGFFHFTRPFSRQQHWEYFKLITFGISDDIDTCPFDFPERPGVNDAVMRNRFWIQAKSWREHVRMVEHLRETRQLSPSVHTVRYEDLCENPVPVLRQLFAFLEVELTEEVENFATKMLHVESIGRWKEYDRYVGDCDEKMESVFESMESELELLGYR